MQAPMKMLDLYRSILDAGGIVCDSEGFCSAKRSDANTPVLIEGKRLVLPTHAQLTSTDYANRIVFHPLTENLLRGESEVITKLRSVFNIRTSFTFAAMGTALLQICASPAEHRKLSPTQAEMLIAIKDVDEKTTVAWSKMMVNLMKEQADRSYIGIYLRRAALIGGKKWSRGGIVSFPVLQELLKDQETYFGVKLRAKDRQAFIQLYNYMLPGCEQAETYNAGSDSSFAPFLDALMKTVMKLASRFNDTLTLFGELIEGSDELLFNADWVDTFEDLSVMRQQIHSVPSQAGNEGRARVSDASANVDTPAAAAPALSYSTPAPAPAPSSVTMQQLQHPVQQSYPYQGPGGPAPAQLVETANGVTFDSLVRTNPALAAAAASFPMMGPSGYGQPVNVRREPRWAGVPSGFGNFNQPNQGYGMNPGYPQQGGYGFPAGNNFGGGGNNYNPNAV